MLHKSGAKLALKSVMAKRRGTKRPIRVVFGWWYRWFFVKYFVVS